MLLLRIRCAGIDVQLSEIGEAIEEVIVIVDIIIVVIIIVIIDDYYYYCCCQVMESHEVEINGKVYPIKCCRNLYYYYL